MILFHSLSSVSPPTKAPKATPKPSETSLEEARRWRVDPPMGGAKFNSFALLKNRPTSNLSQKETTYLEPETSIYKCLFQLDDSNLYIGNGCFTKHPFINSCLEFQVYIILKNFSGAMFVKLRGCKVFGRFSCQLAWLGWV